MEDGKVLEFKRRGSNNDNRPPPPPDLEMDDYRFVVWDKKGGQIEYLKRGHLIVTNVNLALLDEKSELKWSIPNNSDLVYLERIEPEVEVLTQPPEVFSDDPNEEDE